MPMFDRLHTEPVYNTRAVVLRTGVPADTFRAWERRYGAPSPCRTEGNQRLYSERDVAIICWLRDQTKSGLTISHAVTLFQSIVCDQENRADEQRDTLNRLREPGTNLAEYRLTSAAAMTDFPSQDVPRRSMSRSCLDFINALTAYDAQFAERIVEELMAFSNAETICHELLEPALVEIGRRWESGTLPTSAEHFASAFVLRKANALFNISHPHLGRGPIVAACVEGEMHEIGLMFTSLFLSRNGFQVIYLGANLPACDLVNAVTSLRPPLVLLSTSSEAVIPALERTITALHKIVENPASPAPNPVVGYGGSVFNHHPELRRRIDAVFVGCNGYQAVDTCSQLLSQQKTEPG